MAESSFKTADLIDAYGQALQVCETPFRDFGGHRRFCGLIRTLKVHEDNALLKATLSQPGEGAVLVVDGGGSLRTALVGDVIAALGAANGWAGLVIYGAVRDMIDLALVPIGIKALGTTPRTSSKTGSGIAGQPLAFGNVTFSPGTWLAADSDGIVLRALPPEEGAGDA